jgi:iron(III) transport system substrate-binding protein
MPACVLALFCGILVVPAVQAASIEELAKAAQKEGALNFIDTAEFADPSFTNVLEDGIKKKYGVTLRINGTAGPNMSQMVSRLALERQANQKPSTDFIRLSTRQRARLIGGGVTEPVDWRAYDPSIKPEEITKDGSGLIVAARNVDIVYNTDRVRPDLVPKTIDELADPKYKGMIGTTPYGTGWGEIGLLYGQDYALTLAKKIAPNIAGYTGSSSFEPVITGQLPIFAFSTNGDLALDFKEKGAPLEVTTPFLAYLMGSVNMLKGSANPNAARLLTIFLRTPEGQHILRTLRNEDSPFIESSVAYKAVQEAKAANKRILLYTEDDVLKNDQVFTEMVPKISKMFKAHAR